MAAGNRFIMAVDLHAYLAGRGAVPAAELRNALGISPATLSRLVAARAGTVVRLGRGRGSCYALTRRLGGLPARLPVFQLDSRGRAAPAGELVLLEDGGTWVQAGVQPGVQAAAGPAHAHAGLPPVIVDMAPAGYLGRRFSARYPELNLPNRLDDWNENHRLLAVARRGEDCPGNLIVGEESLQRFFDTVPEALDSSGYPQRAEASALGGAGSSAGGEFPKFAAFTGERHVLVKFTPGDGSPSDARWRDLLVCEAVALGVLGEHGIAAAQTRIVDVGVRRYLEVERFDRIGARGRRGVLTLGPLDDDLFGQRDSWTEAAERLAAAKLLSAADARTIRLLDTFGCYIANTDRHFGNIAFFADGLQARPGLKLAPVYDMLPMGYAPNAGSVPALAAPEVSPRPKWLDVWEQAAVLAREYWRRVVEDDRISESFRDQVRRF